VDQFRRLLAFVRPYRGRLFLELAAILAHSLLDLARLYAACIEYSSISNRVRR
jgi:hypothetical protein